MDRLTKKNENGTAHFYPQCFEKCGGIGYSRKCDNCDLLDMVCDKLGKYEDLEEQGKLLKLPCAVGDTYFCIDDYPNEWEFVNVQQIISVMDKIGRTVFLTREEAEAALKEAQS